MVLNSAATALIWPTMGALMANQVPLPEQGQISGANTALGSLMSVFGPLWAGAIYDQYTSASVRHWFHAGFSPPGSSVRSAPTYA
jgi:MFS family permease